jgi:hypothetical protein
VTTRRIGGANRPSTSELVQIDPPRAWAVRGTDGPIRAAVDVRVEPLAGDRRARKEMPANMAALKRKMEAG